MRGIVGSSSDREGIVVVGSVRSVSLGLLKRDFVFDSRVDILRYYLYDGKFIFNCSFSCFIKVGRVFFSSIRNKGLNGDEIREGESFVRGLVIDVGDVECGFLDDCFDE